MSKPRSRIVWRKVDGLLLLDKPRGISSSQALQRARHLFRAEKGGHTGSLDPLATGLLPLCFGETTKIAGNLLAERKAYETIARFGIETDSGDADGTVIARCEVPPLTPAVLRSEIAAFVGEIEQVPPVYSAIKQGGEPLYLKARRGEAVEVPRRRVQVHAIDLLDHGADFARLRIECGSGTYVRSLVRDLGAALGCGAHVEALRRLWVDPFRQPRMHTLETLQSLAHDSDALDALLLPVEAGLAGLPSVVLDAAQSRRLGRGQAVALSGGVPAGEVVAFDPEGLALGFCEGDGVAWLQPRRLFQRAIMHAERDPGRG